MLKKTTILLAIFVLFGIISPINLYAHALDGIDLSKISRFDVGLIYFKIGYQHIIPLGFDHILFVLGLFLLSPKLKTVIAQATVFTIAHSITLALSMYGVISMKSSFIEPVIALSIVFVAIENILISEINSMRIIIVFLFGMIHGLGFASALSELGLPESEFMSALLMFNIGVECGQITIILLAFFTIGFWFNKKPWYRTRIVYPASGAIALIALYWTFERIL